MNYAAMRRALIATIAQTYDILVARWIRTRDSAGRPHDETLFCRLSTAVAYPTAALFVCGVFAPLLYGHLGHIGVYGHPGHIACACVCRTVCDVKVEERVSLLIALRFTPKFVSFYIVDSPT